MGNQLSSQMDMLKMNQPQFQVPQMQQQMSNFVGPPLTDYRGAADQLRQVAGPLTPEEKSDIRRRRSGPRRRGGGGRIRRRGGGRRQKRPQPRPQAFASTPTNTNTNPASALTSNMRSFMY